MNSTHPHFNDLRNRAAQAADDFRNRASSVAGDTGERANQYLDETQGWLSENYRQVFTAVGVVAALGAVGYFLYRNREEISDRRFTM